MKIILGVVDLPYVASVHEKVRLASAKARRQGKRVSAELEKLSSNPTGAQTTGDVARILEDKYHVMELFFEEHRQFIADHLAESVSDKMQDIISGAPVGAGSPIDAGASEIEDRFKQFLSLQEVERLGIPGVPTQAALDGVNHRLKKKRGARRPSFIDTGLYEASFKVWSG